MYHSVSIPQVSSAYSGHPRIPRLLSCPRSTRPRVFVEVFVGTTKLLVNSPRTPTFILSSLTVGSMNTAAAAAAGAAAVTWNPTGMGHGTVCRGCVQLP